MIRLFIPILVALTHLGADATSYVDLSQPFDESPDFNRNSGAQSLERETGVDGSFRNLIDGYIVLRNGEKVAEFYNDDFFNDMSASTTNDVYSVTKSFTGLCFGIMEHQGVISLSETLGDVWTDGAVWANVDGAQQRQQITIEQLLTHTCGYTDDVLKLDFDNLGGSDLTSVLNFPDFLGEEEIGNFNYLASSNILAYVVLERTGRSIQDYMADEYFSKVGMARSEYDWSTNADGQASARSGLVVTVEQMAKWGQLYLQQGYVDSATQLVAPDWVDRSTSAKAPIEPTDILYSGLSPVSQDLQYGYMVIQLDSDFYCAYGAFGQYICVWPSRNLVAACQIGGNVVGTEIGNRFINLVKDSTFGAEATTPPMGTNNAVRFRWSGAFIALVIFASFAIAL